MREFVEGGGTLIADGQPAAFDEHCRRLPKPWLADLFEQKPDRAILLKADVLNYHQDRVVGKEGEVKRMMGEVLGRAGIRPEFAVTDGSGNPVTGVETHVFRNGGVRLVALLTNPELRIDELGPPEFRSNDRFAKPVTVRLRLPGERFVYDVRGAKGLGRRRELSVTLDPYEPTIFAVAAEEIPAMQLAAPARVPLGGRVAVGIRFTTATPAENHVLHIDVVNPSGKAVPFYSGNLVAHEGTAAREIPLALNDPPGRWEVRVKDILSGQLKTAAFEVY